MLLKKLALTLGLLFGVTIVSAQDNSKFIAYTEAGQGRPLILIHAFPTGQHLWDPQLADLKQDFRVITLDLWGFGKSAPTDGKAVTMTEYADEVKQLMDQLHINKAIIGGESMGGYIALAFAKKYPNNVDGLILANTQSIADTKQAKEQREKTATALLKKGTADLISNFANNALSSDAPTEMRQSLRNMLGAQPATGMASALRGMSSRHDTANVLANINVPVLIITGDKDNVIPPVQSEDMHKLAKNSRLVIIKNAGHLSNMEQSKEWDQAVREMFK